MDRNDIFKERFEKVRNERKVTQKEIADALGLTSQAISSYLSGRTKPSLDIAAKIAEFLGVSLDWLCGISEEKTITSGIPVTYTDLILILSKLIKMNMSVDISYEFDTPPFFKCNASINFHDYQLAKFFKEWIRINKLKDNGTIDEEICDLWIEKQLRNEWTKSSFLDNDSQIKLYEQDNPNWGQLPF